MAIKITMLGTQAQIEMHGLVSANTRALTDTWAIETEQEVANTYLVYTPQISNKGQITIELYNKNGIKVASGSKQTLGTEYPAIQLFGDTGVAAGVVSGNDVWAGLAWNVDVASFSTGSIRLLVSGKIQFISAVQAYCSGPVPAGAGSAVEQDIGGNGTYELVLPFTVEVVA